MNHNNNQLQSYIGKLSEFSWSPWNNPSRIQDGHQPPTILYTQSFNFRYAYIS